MSWQRTGKSCWWGCQACLLPLHFAVIDAISWLGRSLRGFAYLGGVIVVETIVDLYQLRQINDRYGYLCGDEVLKRCAKILKTSFRQEDLIGRWSDEKFIVVLYGADKSSIDYHFLEIVTQFKRESFVSPQGNPFTVNLAVGIANYQQGDNLQSIYDRAKQSLVESVRKQRNALIAFSTPEAS